MPQQLDSTVSTARSGTSPSTVSAAPMAPKDFWWQWPCSSARQKFLEQQCVCGEPPRLVAVDQRGQLVAEAEHAARLQPHDRQSARDQRRKRGDATLRLAARLVDEPDREKRAPAAERTARPVHR